MTDEVSEQSRTSGQPSLCHLRYGNSRDDSCSGERKSGRGSRGRDFRRISRLSGVRLE